jgi:mono/diheme cytochrome c family protein
MRTFAVAGVIVGVVSGAVAQTPGSPERGLAVAKEECAVCHAIDSATRQSPNGAAPPFPDIAGTPGMTANALYVALRTPHNRGQMPLVLPNDDDLRDVIAYIRSLARQHP